MTTLVKIISQPKYLAIAIMAALTIIVFAAWLPNLHLVSLTFTSSNLTFWQKTNLLISLAGSLQTNFSLFSLSVIIVNALLAGIQTSLLIYYLRQTAEIQKETGMSFAGITASLLGVGCASCGSVVLSSLIGFGSTAVILNFLPFRGQEFGFLGIGILLFAIHFTMKKINDPLVCGVKSKEGL